MAERHVQDLLALDRDVARAAKALARWRLGARRRVRGGRRRRSVRGPARRGGEVDVGAPGRAVAERGRRAAAGRPPALGARVRAGAHRRRRRRSRGRAKRPPLAGASKAIGRGRCRGARRGAASCRAGRPPKRASGSTRPRTRRRLSLPSPGCAAARRVEVARRMGFAHPWEPAAAVGLGPLRASASRFLERTDDLSRAVWRESLGAEPGAAAVLHAAVAPRGRRRLARAPHAALARGAVRRRHPRAARSSCPLFPQTLGAASFARALALFGHAVRVASAAGVDALRARVRSMVRRRPPARVRLRGARRGPRVLRPGARRRPARRPTRRRGSSRGRRSSRPASSAARVLARRRRGALRATRSTTSPRASSALPIDRRFHGRVARRTRGRAGALARALARARRFATPLRDRFDADWFRNPRAWAHLRAQGAGPAFEAVDEGSLEAGGDALVRSFEHALG